MKNTKRILALVLSLAMMIGMIATVGAATSNAWYMPAVTYIENCGIDTIGTKDATPITRNDFVYWVAKVMTHQLDDEAWDQSVLADIIVFNDVKDEHHKAAIASSYQRGYIKGDGNGNFYPDQVLTLAEAATVIVRMLGYGDFVTYDDNNWEYSYIEYAAQKGIIDEVFWANTKTADPDYELTFGEAAYLLATVMNYKATDATPKSQLILTWDGVNLGDLFANSQTGKYKVTAIVTEMDYEWDDQDSDVSNYVKGFGVNYTTRIVDLDGLNSLGTNTKTAAGAASKDKYGTVDATDVISDAAVNLVCFYTNGEYEELLVPTLELQGFVRVSLGLDAEVGEDEEWELGDYIYNGTAMTVTIDKSTGGVYSVELLDQLYVDTYIVATALNNKYVTGWTANELGSADYTMVLPSSYTADKHFDVEATAHSADGTVIAADLTIGGKTYTVAQSSILESSLDDSTIVVVDLLDVTTPLTPAEVIEAIPNTAEGEVSLVFSDINGDGAYDVVVVQENFWFSYRNYVNAKPASDGFAKSIPMGGVVIDALAKASTSVSTDPYTLDLTKKTNKIQLVIIPTNDRYVYQYGSYGAGENAYDGLYCLPAYKIVDLMPLKTAYIESATALATDGFYEVVFVNTDGSRTTAYVPMQGETAVTYIDENDVEHTVYKTVKGELVYNELDKVAVTYKKGTTTYDVLETSTGKRVYKVDTKYYFAKAFTDGDTVYAVDAEATLTSAEVTSLATAYDNKIVFSGSNATVDGWYLVEDFKNGSFTGVAGEEIVIATSEVAAIVPYTKATYVPATRDFEIEIEGAKTTVTLDSSTWNSFVTQYVFNEDTGISSVADRNDTAAWMVGHYVKYAIDDKSTTIVLIPTEAKEETGLIVSVEKTDTGDNTFNVTMGVSGAITLANPLSLADTYWSYIRNLDVNTMETKNYVPGNNGNYKKYSYTLRHWCEIMGFEDIDAYADVIIARADAAKKDGNKYPWTTGAITNSEGNAWAYMRNVITTAKAAGYTVTGTETLATLRTYSDTNVTNILNNTKNFDTSVTNDTMIKDVLKSVPGFNFETMLANILANKENVAINLKYGYIVTFIGRCAAAGSYYKLLKAAATPGDPTDPNYQETYYYTSAYRLKGPTSVVTHEVRVSASTVIWDYENYSIYNTVFSQGRLVNETSQSTTHLSGFDLIYGTFYSDAGKLYTIKVLNEDTSSIYEEANVYPFSYYWVAADQMANKGSDGSNLYLLKGYIFYAKTDANEAGSFMDYTDIIVLSETPVGDKTVNDLDKTYTQNVNIKFAYLPYYLKLYSSNGNIVSYERRWTAIVDAVAVATGTPVKGNVYRTYIPVVDENGNQIESKSDSDTAWWESQIVDSQNVPVEYKVINNLVYKVNTVGNSYLYENGKIVYDVEYNIDLDVVKAAIAKAQTEADLNSADFKVTVNPVVGAEVAADVVTANRGDTVTVTYTTDNDVTVTDVVVTYTENDQTWSVSAAATDTEGTVTFVMPAADVQVTAVVESANPGANVYTYAATVADTTTATVAIAGDPTALVVGSTVTFTVTPVVNDKVGYAVKSVVVTDANDAKVATTVKGGVYSFTMPETDVTVKVETEALDFYVLNVDVDVLIEDKDVISLVSFRKMEQGETGWIPNAYEVVIGKDKFVAAGNRNVIVMTPDFTNGNVTGTVTTIEALAESGKGLFFTKYVPAASGSSMSLLTVIGEICNAEGGISGQPVGPVTQTTKVYLASGKSVITMDETGNYYYVTSITSAVDFETKTTQVGAISVRYNTYVEAVYAAVLRPVLTDGGTYYIVEDGERNIVVG